MGTGRAYARGMDSELPQGTQAPTADELLAELAQSIADEGLLPVDVVAQWPAAREAPPQTMGRLGKLSYSHAAMIDQIVSNPGISQQQLATLFGYTPAWICNIMASDIFKAALAKRRKEVVDPLVLASVEELIEGMTRRGIEVLQEKLARPSNAIDDKLVLGAVQLGMKGMGIGGNAPPSAPLDPDRLLRLAERLSALRGEGRPEPRTFDVTPQEVANG